jgi:hypothetical protein
VKLLLDTHTSSSGRWESRCAWAPLCSTYWRIRSHPLLQRGGFLEIPITADHVLAVGSLPPLHRDPFDRLLLAQAERGRLLLITADQTVARYPGPVRHSGSC